MDKQKKEKLILLIAVLIFAMLFSHILFRKKQTEPLVPSEVGPMPVMVMPGSVAAQEAPAVQENVPQVKPQEPDAHPAVVENKNPFEVPYSLIEKMKAGNMLVDSEDDSWEDPNAPKLNLQGVVWGSDAPIAFIDGKVYKKGDIVGDAKIIDIDKKGVYLLNNGERVLVRIKK